MYLYRVDDDAERPGEPEGEYTAAWFSSKAEAIRDARNRANWIERGALVWVTREQLRDKTPKALLLAILNRSGFIDESVEVYRAEGRR